MENVTLTGIDLAKESFEVRMENHTGRLVRRVRVGRARLIGEISKLPKQSTIAMEACGSAHYWGREFEKIGLRVVLIAPQFVTPFRKSQKNDSNDAAAICEAARRPTMRFVSLKSQEQLDLQMLHRMRESLVRERTALMNQIRGFLLERGITVARGARFLRARVKELCALSEQVTTVGSFVLKQLWERFESVDRELSQATKLLEKVAREDERCVKIQKLSGVGPITATAIVAANGNMNGYKNGRNFAASLGVVPRQFSTGGVPRLGRITKHGDGYIRKLLVHGARAVVHQAVRKKKDDDLSLWIRALHERSDTNRCAVALANKTARHIWAVLAGKSHKLRSNVVQRMQ